MPETLLPVQSELLSPLERDASFQAYGKTATRREHPNRYWKIDLDTLDFGAFEMVAASNVARISGGTARGVIICDLETAKRDHGALFNAAFGKALAQAPSKFAYLTRAFTSGGAFVYVPDGVCVADPIVIRYTPHTGAAFPYTLVLTGTGAECTIIEELKSTHAGIAVAAVAEIVAGASAHVTYASIQELPEDAQVLTTRVALPGRDATISWAVAELGSALSASSIDVTIEQPGVTAQVAALFFPRGNQHVDMISTVDHRSGGTQSQTVIKSAATGSGQARYLGNIRILPNAHGTDASLRDDALLLSKKAHIDSIPALEIAANDVKAFHGATVGAIDEEQIFYMTSRGLERREAERMIALGFFEPAIARFPGESLRERLREALQKKVVSE
ncbi:MAG: Fe-S cluster assembly protein SufD [Candidatus Eremiobacteraeota bacterium]|nr:Fe-S cluster assembly protein SufD [Candidatus Eremiobacteraeota bacterium]